MKRFLYLVIIALSLLGGCSTNKVQLSTEQKLLKADELFAKKKYAKAAVIYEEISFERKSAATALAMLKQSECHFRMNNFIDARLKYNQFTQMFPDHPEISTAYFRIGVCYYEESLPPQYDQYETELCISSFKLFIEKFPSDARFSEAIEYIRKSQYKLLEKTYHNGYIHYRMHDYSGALMYFDEITKLGNQDQLDKMSLYYSALIQIKQNVIDDARLTYDKLKTKYPGAKETATIAKRL